MKTMLLIPFLYLNVSIYAQPEIINKTFVTTIEWICEETEEELACTGEQTLLLLQFEEKFVSVKYHDVDSCGEIIAIKIIGRYNWLWAKNKHWGIILDQDSIKGTLLEYMTFIIIDKQLIGRKLEPKNEQITEYTFRESIKI